MPRKLIAALEASRAFEAEQQLEQGPRDRVAASTQRTG